MKRTTLSLIACATALAAVTGFAMVSAPDTSGAATATPAARLPVERTSLLCPAPSTSDLAETAYTSFTPVTEGVEEKGSAAAPHEMYRASKTLAERAAWKFVEINKGKLNFDVVVLNPPFVFGPVMHEVNTPDALNTSMLDWYNTVVKGTRTPEQLASIRYVLSAVSPASTPR